MTPLDPDTFERMCSFRSADDFHGVDIVSAFAIARALAPAFTADGYQQVYSSYADATTVYRITADAAPERVSFRAFAALVESRLGVLLDEALALPMPPRGVDRVRALRAVLRDKERGYASYLRAVVLGVRDRLVEADLDDLGAAATDAPRPSFPSDATRADRRRHSSPAAREKALDDARYVIGGYFHSLNDDPHPLPSLWRDFEQVCATSAKIRDEYPGALTIGRTTFYELADELAIVRSGGARTRYLIVPEILRIRVLMRKGRRVEALQLQARRHAAERAATAPHNN
jgi:hypothetical protein